jgi:hypothetical protein
MAALIERIAESCKSHPNEMTSIMERTSNYHVLAKAAAYIELAAAIAKEIPLYDSLASLFDAIKVEHNGVPIIEFPQIGFYAIATAEVRSYLVTIGKSFQINQIVWADEPQYLAFNTDNVASTKARLSNIYAAPPTSIGNQIIISIRLNDGLSAYDTALSRIAQEVKTIPIPIQTIRYEGRDIKYRSISLRTTCYWFKGNWNYHGEVAVIIDSNKPLLYIPYNYECPIAFYWRVHGKCPSEDTKAYAAFNNAVRAHGYNIMSDGVITGWSK